MIEQKEKGKNQNLDKRKILNIVLIIWLLVVGCIFLYINLAQYKLGLNADIAAEGMLAKIIWESKQWVPQEWYFSTESRLISVADCAAIFYGMTGSICTSMGLACVVAGVFILLSLWSLCKELQYSLTQKLFFLLLLMILPNNKGLLELMFIYAGHYAFHIGLYFLTLALYLKMLTKKKIKYYQVFVIAVLHFVLGIQGVRGILMITGPLLFVEVIRRLYLWWCKKQNDARQNAITCFVLVLNVIGSLGGKLPMSIGQPLSRNIRKAPQKLVEIVIPDFLQVFNWNNITIMEKMIWFISILASLYVMFRIIFRGIRKEEVTIEHWIFLNFVSSVILTIAALTFTTVESSSRYFVVIYFAIAMCFIMFVGKEHKLLNGIVILVVSVLFVVNGNKFYYPMIIDRSYEVSDYAKVGEYLIQQGYENAYTGFEHANTITVMNDGKVQVSAIDSYSTMAICKWLTSKKWYVPNVPLESKTAYILSDNYLEEFEVFLLEHKDTVEFKTKIGMFNIYGSEYNYSQLTD